MDAANSPERFAELNARHLAIYEKELSNCQFLLVNLMDSKRRLKMNPSAPSRYAAFMPSAKMSKEEEDYESWKKLVCDVFIKAVFAGDRQTIIELADAAEFFKDKMGDDYVPADPVRLKLLSIKNQPRAFPIRFTIRQIAEQVYEKNQIAHHSVDGFSALRRKCKELKIPIRPSRKIRKKQS